MSSTSHRFAVGDRVRVIRRHPSDSSRIAVGMVGTVERVGDGTNTSWPYTVRFPEPGYGVPDGTTFTEGMAEAGLELAVVETPAEPRVWEIPDEPEDVIVVHTHDQNTGEPIVWERVAMGRWARADRLQSRYSWVEVLARGPIIEGRPAPEYTAGFYRLSGSLPARRDGGSDLEIAAGSLISVGYRHLAEAWVAMSPDGQRVVVTEDALTAAGAKRVDNP